MADKNFWDEIINEVKSMSSEEFLAFVDECENMPDIPIIMLDDTVCDFSPVKSDTKFDISLEPKLVLSKDSVYNGIDWACVA